LKPLRDRNEDIPELVQFFVNRYRTKMNKPVEGVEPQALNMLMKYAWPGNIRELENSIERAMVVTKKNILSQEDFILSYADEKMQYYTEQSLDSVEKTHILSVLKKNNWNISASAKILGIDRVTIYKKLEKYGINRPENV
jgi:transcriptional regulator with PAS, ATPase and Fis domain